MYILTQTVLAMGWHTERMSRGEEYLPFMDGGWLTCWAGLCFNQTGNAYLISWCNCLYWWESGQLNSVVVCWMSDDASERVQSSEE